MQTEKKIILFDGECNLCNFWVNYVVKRDKKDDFRFTPLGSTKAIDLMKLYNIDTHVDTIVLIEKKTYLMKSTAALRILKSLGGFRSVFYGLIIFPRFIRDFFYDVIARYRYNWFGKSSCEFIPPQHLKNKFLM